MRRSIIAVTDMEDNLVNNYGIIILRGTLTGMLQRGTIAVSRITLRIRAPIISRYNQGKS